MRYSSDYQRLKSWFLRTKRDLPWRVAPSPYAVWVSEVMLQQTQVSTVIPYFERWMQRFPTVAALARAPLDDVLKLWEGLGYYTRARNLLEGACYVLKHHGGTLPSDATELAKIKGLGPYTVGAIRSFAFHHKAAAVDGNVLRVFARYRMIREDIRQGATVRAIREAVEAFLPDDESWIVNEALIELGATMCRKVPACAGCPLRRSCLALRHGMASELPTRTPPPTAEPLYRAVAVISCGGLLLIKRGTAGKIMQDLYEFPYAAIPKGGMTPQQVAEIFTGELALPLSFVNLLEPVVHTFTRYRAYLTPICLVTAEPKKVKGYQWLSREQLDKRAFSSGHRKIYRASFLLAS